MGATDYLNLPYPENTDPLADMAAAIQALANALDQVEIFKGYKAGGAIAANQSIPWAEEFRVGAGSYANGVYTIGQGGHYRVYSCVKHDGTSNEVGLMIRRNGGVYHYSPNNGVNGGFTGSHIQTLVTDCVAGDQITIAPQGAVTLVSDAPAQNAVLIIERLLAQ